MRLRVGRATGAPAWACPVRSAFFGEALGHMFTARRVEGRDVDTHCSWCGKEPER